MSAIGRIATRAFADVMNVVYPGVCAVCADGPIEAQMLCESCAKALDDLAAAPACPLCAVSLVNSSGPCPWCKNGSFYPYQRIVRLGPFKDPLKHLIHHVKYHQRWPLGQQLAQRLLKQEPVKGLLTQTDCLVAVPLHWSRQIHRGYNQAAVIAQWLGKACQIKVTSPIVRRKPTAMQTAIHSRARRVANLRNAFVLVDPSTVRGRHVVVIDDVMTTAATLQTLGRALKAAEPASLCAIVLAVAEPHPRDVPVF